MEDLLGKSSMDKGARVELVKATAIYVTNRKQCANAMEVESLTDEQEEAFKHGMLAGLMVAKNVETPEKIMSFSTALCEIFTAMDIADKYNLNGIKKVFETVAKQVMDGEYNPEKSN